ncbi:MAG: DUF4340 domain-containing protein [Acidobacteria bacterium]|nr:DUF4340 domain-containing protein [Acidobacteriota bacterium]
MKIRGLVIAAFVLLVLTGFLYWSGRHRPGGDANKISADTPPAILKLDQAAITGLELKKKDAEPLQLEKTSSGEWKITAPRDLRADQSNVSSLISTLSSLNSERLLEDKAADLKTFGLERPSLEVDIREKDNKSERLLIGDDTPAGGGVYAMRAGDGRVFTLASYDKTAIDKNLNDLRDKRLVTLETDKISRLELVRKNLDLEFGRNKDEWQILKPRPLRADNTQVSDLVSKLAEAKMDVSAGASNDAGTLFARGNPVATAKLTDQSGTQELQIHKNKDNFYAESSALAGAYKIDSDLGKAVDKNLDDFRNKKLFDFGYNQPTKLELHNGSKAYFLTRSAKAEDWWSDGKKMDGGTVESLISKFRDLSARKFVDSGFSDPEIAATVISDDGKRTEKVAIRKSGDHYIAKRENEPTLYELDAASVEDTLKAADAVKPSASSESGSKKP